MLNMLLEYDGFGGNLLDRTARPFGPFGYGVQYIFRFDNGYGASVVKGLGTFGHREDLWELAVIYFGENNEYSLDFDTEITDDVLGHLTDKEVRKTLSKIKKLPIKKEKENA